MSCDVHMTCADAAEAKAENARRFRRGVIVTLNSGGVLMTVVDTDDCCTVGVALADNGRLVREDFFPECLRVASQDEIDGLQRVGEFPF